jgi:hypothetical protein
LKETLVFFLSLLSAAAMAVAGDVSFKLYVEDAGVYTVSHDELVEAGLPPEEIESSLVGLSNRGEAVAVFVNDGGDGLFGPGDSIEFVAERLSSPGMYFHEYSKYNVYWLSFDGQSVRPTKLLATSRRATRVEPISLTRGLHIEHDQLLIRVRASEMKTPQDSDLWFWAKLTNIYDKTNNIKVPMPGLQPRVGASVDLRIGARGLSRPRQRSGNKIPEHSLEVSVNGTPIGSWEWDGRLAHVIEIPGLDPGLFQHGANEVELTVPSRSQEGSDEPIVDVVMLNWVELDYPHSGAIGAGQTDLQLTDTAMYGVPTEDRVVELAGPASTVVYTDDGARIKARVVKGRYTEDQPRLLRFELGEASEFLVSAGPLKQVGLIERDRPSELRNSSNQADYLMIAHERLIPAVAPLVEMHSARGLEVAVIDVEDVYDEFNHGILDPTAIRDFVSHAYHEWSAPAPRFVLLVGDASWDTKNTTADDRFYADWAERDVELGGRFVRNEVPVYAEKTALNHRQLVPTWNYTSHEGHSASDNFFVAVDGDDFFPDLAIGRFPVTEVEEVEAIVAKTIRYATETEPGLWRRNLLWITNESKAFQGSSDRMAFGMAQRGFSNSKVYPNPAEVSNQTHQLSLQRMLNEGQLIVHFLGHGGRHIWRTGPPDYQKNHDLFTLDHVAELDESDRLTLIMSMTCYSAPFDHPNQDSIGEMFLRVPDRGAIGVFGASWRNSPARPFSQALLDELTVPGATIGEAIMRAKKVTRQRTLVETYNLLGDPAAVLAVPAGRVDLRVEESEGEILVSGSTQSDATGASGLLEWLDEDLVVLHTEELSLSASEFRVTVEQELLPADDEVAGVRVYLWHDEAGWDAIGWWPPVDEPEPVQAQLENEGEKTKKTPDEGSAKPEGTASESK